MLRSELADARMMDDLDATLMVLRPILPQGWEQRLNKDTIDIGSPTACALAQIYGNWSRGARVLEEHNIPLDQVPAIEINAEGMSKRDRQSAYRRRTLAWVRKIPELQANARA